MCAAIAALKDITQVFSVIRRIATLQLLGQSPAAFQGFSAESFNLVGRHVSEVWIEPFARLKLLAVDKKCIWARQGVPVFVKIAE